MIVDCPPTHYSNRKQQLSNFRQFRFFCRLRRRCYVSLALGPLWWSPRLSTHQFWWVFGGVISSIAGIVLAKCITVDGSCFADTNPRVAVFRRRRRRYFFIRRFPPKPFFYDDDADDDTIMSGLAD